MSENATCMTQLERKIFNFQAQLRRKHIFFPFVKIKKLNFSNVTFSGLTPKKNHFYNTKVKK